MAAAEEEFSGLIRAVKAVEDPRNFEDRFRIGILRVNGICEECEGRGVLVKFEHALGEFSECGRMIGGAGQDFFEERARFFKFALRDERVDLVKQFGDAVGVGHRGRLACDFILQQRRRGRLGGARGESGAECGLCCPAHGFQHCDAMVARGNSGFLPKKEDIFHYLIGLGRTAHGGEGFGVVNHQFRVRRSRARRLFTEADGLLEAVEAEETGDDAHEGGVADCRDFRFERGFEGDEVGVQSLLDSVEIHVAPRKQKAGHGVRGL